MDIIYDGVEVYCLPDTAKCELADENPMYMSNCPAGNDYCVADCPHYTEEN